MFISSRTDMSGRKRKISSKSTSSKTKRRRKHRKKSSTEDFVDFRQHVGLLGGLRLDKPNDAHVHIKKVRHFVEQRQHADFFEVLPQILSPRFLYYSRIFHKNYDGLILFLWQYCLLGRWIYHILIHVMTSLNMRVLLHWIIVVFHLKSQWSSSNSSFCSFQRPGWRPQRAGRFDVKLSRAVQNFG